VKNETEWVHVEVRFSGAIYEKYLRKGLLVYLEGR